MNTQNQSKVEKYFESIRTIGVLRQEWSSKKKVAKEEKQKAVEESIQLQQRPQSRLIELRLLALDLASYNSNHKTNLVIEGLAEEVQYLEDEVRKQKQQNLHPHYKEEYRCQNAHHPSTSSQVKN